jgi:hypothetical protein
MTALGLRKGTAGRVTNIDQLVMLYCERETYRIQNFDANVDQIDTQLLRGGVGSKATLDMIWSVIHDIILERLTRKPIRKRNSVA